MRRRSDWSAWACLVGGYGLSLLMAVSAASAIRAPERGVAVFQRLCAGCHGEAGGAPVKQLPRPFDYDSEFVRATVREGRGEMPAFSPGQLSDADVDAVADFLRSGAPR